MPLTLFSIRYTLALDVTTDWASLALARCHESQGFYHEQEPLGREASSRLVPWIQETLRTEGIACDQVNRILVPRGPGSFTGIRLGLAVAQGFSLAVGTQPIGVNLIHFLAHHIRDRTLCSSPFGVFIPTHRNDAIGCVCGANQPLPEHLKPLQDPQILSAETLQALHQQGLPMFWDRHIPEVFAPYGVAITWDARDLIPYGAVINGEASPLIPLYVRPPSVTQVHPPLKTEGSFEH